MDLSVALGAIRDIRAFQGIDDSLVGSLDMVHFATQQKVGCMGVKHPANSYT